MDSPTLNLRRAFTAAFLLGLLLLLGGAARAQTTTPTATPAPEGEDRDCSDFETQEEAQKFYEDQGGPSSDPHMLDPDHDGRACEGLPGGTPGPTATPGAAGELPENGAFSAIMALSGLSFLEAGVALTLFASRLRVRRRRLPMILVTPSEDAKAPAHTAD
jgi:hypothetical protein